MTGKPRKVKIRGDWQWYCDAPHPLTGKRTRKFFPTEKAAAAYQKILNKQPTRPAHLHPEIDPEIAWQPFATAWLETQRLAGKLRRNTLTRYRLHLDAIARFPLDHRTTLGATPVRTVTAKHIVALATTMRREHCAPRTVAGALRLVRLLLDLAVHRGLLVSHPITAQVYRNDLQVLVTVPRHKKREVRAFDERDAQIFLATARAHSPLADVYAVGVLAGLRLGELLGLQLDDDITSPERRRTLHIERTLYRGSATAPVCGPCKGGEPRDVDVSAALGQLLDRIRAQRPRLAMQHGWRPIPPWLFVTSAGHIIDQEQIRRDFKRTLLKAGLGHLKLSPHALRHTFATAHARRGCNVQWLRQQLGHSSVKITLDTYGNHFPIPDVGAADALADALVGNTSGNTTTA
jgi:integrase